MLGKLRSLDVYRKIPKDYTESTLSGALISVVSAFIMIILFVSELNDYLNVETTSEMFIDVNRGGDKLTVNINLEFPGLPCGIMSLDCQDVMGSHFVNVGAGLYKQRIAADGTFIGKSEPMEEETEDHGNAGGHNHNNPEIDRERVLKALNDREGCHLTGVLTINKVPGNFHISSHAYSHYIGSLLRESGLNTIDLSHKINHLSFGKQEDIVQIKEKFSEGIFNPLDGVTKIKTDDLSNFGVMHQYYISVVPTTFETLDHKNLYVHQFTVNSNEIKTHMMPAVFFRYDLSPVTVKVAQFSGNFFHFIVQICAIIGGVFTVAGIIDSIVHKTTLALMKKAEIGKLG